MTDPLLVAGVPVFARLADWTGPWAIEPQAGRELARLAKGTDWAAHLREPPRPQAAVEMAPGRKGQSVAVVRLVGPMMKAESSFGGASTIQTRRDVRQAAADPNVSAILLAIDSPGGTVAGTDDLASEVRKARRQKPVWAHIDDLCASAAYWVASQCDEVWANSDTALVGSVGTLSVVDDLSGAAEAAGVKTLVFRTGPLKGAGTAGEPVTDEQAGYFQGIVTDSQRAFDAAVRRGRGLTDAQLAAVKTGGVFLADEARRLKLIDGVRPLDATLAALAAAGAERASQTGGTTPKGATVADDTVTLVRADQPDPIQAERQRWKAEGDRIKAIQAVFGDKHADAKMAAIADGLSVEAAEAAFLKAELAAVRAGRPAVTAHHTLPGSLGRGPDLVGKADGGPPDPAVLAAAVQLTAGVPARLVAADLPDADRQRVLNQAHAARFRGYGLQSLMSSVIAAAGEQYHGSRSSNDFIRSALRAERQLLATGFTTVSLSGILSTTANKVILASYQSVPSTWRRFAAVRNHSDFKTVTRYRLDSKGAFRKVGPDGELKHVGLDSASFTNKVETYGAIVALTRQMMVNDDLGAFTELPAMLGRMGALRVEEAVYALLLANTGSFFHANNRNLVTGGTYVLGEAGLTAAEDKFRLQVDSNGKPILSQAAVLVVPTTLAVTARKLYADTTLIATGVGATAATTTNANPYAGRFDPVVSPYLNNTAITDQDGNALSGQSDTAYYLFADPADRAALGVAFLNGQETPTVESDDTDFDTLGMQWRAYEDFGVGFEDPTAAVKVTGA